MAAIPAPPLEALLAPIDQARSRLLRALAPRWRSLIVARDRRVALAGSCLMITALVFTSALPMWAIALGPILWGVPHIVSDVRYLVTRPGLHRRPWIMASIALGIVGAGFGLGVRGGLLGAMGALLLARAPLARKAAGLAIVGALLLLAQRWPFHADLAFAHLHNVVGVSLWWAWRRREGRLHYLPLALFAIGCALILAGAFEPIVARTGGLVAPWTGLSARVVAYGLSPTTHVPTAMRFLVLYAFAQAAHYLMWLRLIPEDDRPSPTPRSYQQSFRALTSDVGALVMWIAVLSAVGLAIWAALSVGQARNGYIQAAFFHGHLELGAAAVLWVEARAIGEIAVRSPRSHPETP